MNNAKKLILAIALLTIPACMWLLQSGYFLSDDGGWMLIRFTSFYDELRMGQFPVRFLTRLNHGYGYPVATFLYPGFMYLASVLKVLGISFIWSIKLLLIGSMAIAGIFSYLWFRTFASRTAAIIGSLSYVYHPYVLFDLYVRGSVGEVLALSLVPVCLWALAQKRVVLGSLSIGLFLISHNTMVLLLFPFVALYGLYTMGRRGIVPVVVGCGLSAFFWIPALIELPLTVFAQKTISDWRTYFIPSVMLLSVVHGAGFLTLVLRRTKTVLSSLDLSVVIIFIASIILALPISAPVWELFGTARFIQFPFRFLALSVGSGAYLVVRSIDILKNSRYTNAIIAVLVLSSVVSVINFRPERESYPDSWYATNEDTTTVRNEYMPIWVSELPTTRAETKQERISDETLQVNMIYWPGMIAVQSDQKLPITIDNPQGLIHIQTLSDNLVDIQIHETPLRKFANSITIGSALFLGIWIYYQRKRRS